MSHLKFPRQTPPGGWIFLVTETGLAITADNEGSLIAKVIEHRKYKGLPELTPETVKAMIEAQICTRLTDRECEKDGPDDPWVPQKTKPSLRLADVLTLSQSAFKAILGGAGLMAPMEEARRRADICRVCPLNQSIHGCRCAPLYKAISTAIPKDRMFSGLEVCMVCSCSNNASVNVSDQVIRETKGGKDYPWPIHCWVPAILAKQDDSQPKL